MKEYKVKFHGISPLSFGRYVDVPKKDKETHEGYEKRTWREKMHCNSEDIVVITPMMVKNALSASAKYRSEQIPGKGKATYTKHFEAGVIVNEEMPIGIKKEDVKSESLPVPSDGRRGGTTRVIKTFPRINEGWKGEVIIYVLDETITKDVLERHLADAGTFIGLGRFRPRQNGYYGRFECEVEDIKK